MHEQSEKLNQDLEKYKADQKNMITEVKHTVEATSRWDDTETWITELEGKTEIT